MSDIPAEVWDRLQTSTRNLIDRSCLSKTPMGRDSARAVAEVHRAQGDRLQAYRCPFAFGERHWHVGHPPASMEGIEGLALAIRDLGGDLPNNRG